ncbi:MAG: thrombospondin type 3 repeat-containing protein [Spirochaetales bacterium]|nr:thrombospondin type 3 repeat-containing protein [Spirochaetales bacterium]
MLIGGDNGVIFWLHFVEDTDNDGILDNWERLYFNDLTTTNGTRDTDGDNLTQSIEQLIGTNPLLQDTDNDGISDDEELNNGSDPLNKLSFDVIPPQIIGLTSIDKPSQSVNWTWSADENATFRYKLHDQKEWTFNPLTPFEAINQASLSDVNGLWYLHVQAKDAANNISPVWTVSALIDTTPPVAEIHGIPSSPTNSTTASLTINGTDVMLYQWKLDDKTWSNATEVNASIELTDLSEGQHSLSVIDSDQTGNWQTTANATQAQWEVDTTPIPPDDVSVSGYPEGFSPAGSTTLVVNGPGITQYRYAIDAPDWEGPFAVSAASNLDFADLADGNHTLWVEVCDQAGNWQPAASAFNATWTKDTTPPVINGLANSTEPVLSKTWTWSANEEVTYRHAVNQNPTWNFLDESFHSTNSTTLSGAEGSWFLHVQARDQAGNFSSVQSVFAQFWQALSLTIPADQWTLVGISVNASNASIAANLVWDRISKIATWSAERDGFDTAYGGTFDSFHVFEPGQGYFIEGGTSDYSFELQGPGVHQMPPLLPGWNLICVPVQVIPTVTDFFQVFENAGWTIQKLAKWSGNEYGTVSPIDVENGFAAFSIFNAGEGYWVNVTQTQPTMPDFKNH